MLYLHQRQCVCAKEIQPRLAQASKARSEWDFQAAAQIVQDAIEICQRLDASVPSIACLKELVTRYVEALQIDS